MTATLISKEQQHALRPKKLPHNEASQPQSRVAFGLSDTVEEIVELSCMALGLGLPAGAPAALTDLLPKGVLLSSGSGSGKTLVLQLLADRMRAQGVHVVALQCQSLLAEAPQLRRSGSSNNSSSSSALLTAAQEQIDAHPTSLVLLDDLEALLEESVGLGGTQSTSPSEMSQAYATLIAFLEGLRRRRCTAAVVGAARRAPALLPQSLLSRGGFDRVLPLPPLAAHDRRALFAALLRNADAAQTPADASGAGGDSGEGEGGAVARWAGRLADATPGFTGGDARRLLRAAHAEAQARRYARGGASCDSSSGRGGGGGGTDVCGSAASGRVGGDDAELCWSDLEHALARVAPRHLELWMRQRCRLCCVLAAAITSVSFRPQGCLRMSQPPMRASFDLGLTVGHVQRRVPSDMSRDSMDSPEGLKRFKLEEADLLDAQTAVAALFKEGESRFPGIGVCWRKDEHITQTQSGGWRKDVEDVAIVRLERCTFNFYDIPVDFCYKHDDSQFKVVKASQCGLLLRPGPPPPESALAAIKKVAAEKGIPDALAELRKHCQELGWAEPAPHMIVRTSKYAIWVQVDIKHAVQVTPEQVLIALEQDSWDDSPGLPQLNQTKNMVHNRCDWAEPPRFWTGFHSLLPAKQRTVTLQGGVQSHQETMAAKSHSTEQSAMIIACNDAGMEFKTRALIRNANEDSFVALPLPPLNVTDTELATLSAAHAACRDVLQRSSRFVDLPVGPGEGGVKRQDLQCVVEFMS